MADKISLEPERILAINNEIGLLYNSFKSYTDELDILLNNIYGNVTSYETKTALNSMKSYLTSYTGNLTKQIPKLQVFLHEQMGAYKMTDEEVYTELEKVLQRMAAFAETGYDKYYAPLAGLAGTVLGVGGTASYATPDPVNIPSSTGGSNASNIDLNLLENNKSRYESAQIETKNAVANFSNSIEAERKQLGSVLINGKEITTDTDEAFIRALEAAREEGRTKTDVIMVEQNPDFNSMDSEKLRQEAADANARADEAIKVAQEAIANERLHPGINKDETDFAISEAIRLSQEAGSIEGQFFWTLG